MNQYAKAIFATVGAFLAALKLALTDHHVSGAEWVDIAIFTVNIGGGVWAFPNARRAPKPGPKHEAY